MCTRLVEKPLGKWSFGGLRRKWEDNVKMDLREVVCENGRGMEMAQDLVQW
jgi:hypothetical protein